MKKVFLEHHTKMKILIQWNGKTSRILNSEIKYYGEGVGGEIDRVGNKTNIITGVFYRDGIAFFLYDNKEYPIDANNFECKSSQIKRNSSIEVERKFTLISNGESICDFAYIAIFVDYFPYDSEPDEFDVLWHFADGILHDRESLLKFIDNMTNYKKNKRPAFEKALEELESN